jgi:hypothetical protein
MPFRVEERFPGVTCLNDVVPALEEDAPSDGAHLVVVLDEQDRFEPRNVVGASVARTASTSAPNVWQPGQSGNSTSKCLPSREMYAS